MIDKISFNTQWVHQLQPKKSLLGFNQACFDQVGGSQVALVVKNPSANAGDVRDANSIPGSGRSPGEAHGNPLQDSCLENPVGRGDWQAVVHRVTKSQT